jgi:hypothetical protein
MAIPILVKIDSVDLPQPATYDPSTATLVDGARNLQGEFIGSLIRDDVDKINLTWRYLTVTQWSTLLKHFSSDNGGAFENEVTYFSQVEGAFVTKTMYVNDRKAKFLGYNNDETPRGWKDCSLNLIEV